MPRRLNLPDTASIATQGEAGKPFAPSAARNADAIGQMIAEIAPTRGNALELASGTGQHVVKLAAACPGLTWHPTEIAPERRASIDAYVADSGLTNIAPAATLDATTPGWSDTHHGHALVFLSNLLHLISTAEARTLIQNAAGALAPAGVLAIYGPFMRDDELTSEGDRAFHDSLQAQDPEIGYKSDFDVVEWGQQAGLTFDAMIEMPANNLVIVYRLANLDF